MRALRIVATAAVMAGLLASSLPTRAHVPDQCLGHSLRAEEAAATCSRGLRQLSTVSRALGAAHMAAAATGDPDVALEALIDFYENGLPALRDAVIRLNMSSGDSLKAWAETVLWAHGIE